MDLSIILYLGHYDIIKWYPKNDTVEECVFIICHNIILCASGSRLWSEKWTKWGIGKLRMGYEITYVEIFKYLHH